MALTGLKTRHYNVRWRRQLVDEAKKLSSGAEAQFMRRCYAGAVKPPPPEEKAQMEQGTRLCWLVTGGGDPVFSGDVVGGDGDESGLG
jgi:hypothetical protein